MIYNKWFNIMNTTIFASLPLTCVLVCELSVTALLPCLPVCCHAPCCSGHGLTLWNHKPQKILSFYKLTMELCYDNRKVTKINNYDSILLVYAQIYTTVENNWGVTTFLLYILKVAMSRWEEKNLFKKRCHKNRYSVVHEIHFLSDSIWRTYLNLDKRV